MAKMRIVLILLTLLLLLASVAGCARPAPAQPAEDGTPEVSLGEVKINAHPASLEGKTVVLRWNGKPNGDKFLGRVAELLAEQVKGVKVVKLWEAQPKTAVITDGAAASEEVASVIAGYKPDIVIASQCD